MADCPKYHCDNSVHYDCDHCTFIDQHIQETRAFYKKGKEHERIDKRHGDTEGVPRMYAVRIS